MKIDFSNLACSAVVYLDIKDDIQWQLNEYYDECLYSIFNLIYLMSLHTNIFIFNLQHNTSKVPVSNTSESVPTDKGAATSDFNKVMLGS